MDGRAITKEDSRRRGRQTVWGLVGASHYAKELLENSELKSNVIGCRFSQAPLTASPRGKQGDQLGKCRGNPGQRTRGLARKGGR